MSDRNRSNLPFESNDPAEQQLWSELRDLPGEAPSEDLRRGFYNALDDASSETWSDTLRGWLGIGSNAGWATAAACALIGFGVAGGFQGESGSTVEPQRLLLLEENVALLNRELILDRLEDAKAGTRLKGVFDARNAAVSDEQVARALLSIATEDRVPSIRAAAIDVLGPNLTAAGVGDVLMQLLEQTQSPTVQLALIDMVLRNGTGVQLDQLLEMARSGRLHQDLRRHVINSLGSETA